MTDKKKSRATPRAGAAGEGAGVPATPRKSRKAAAARRAARKQVEAGRAENAIVTVDVASASLFGTLRTDLGDSLVDSIQAEKLIIGLRVPSLAVRYLFGHDIVPLGRNLMFVGEPGSCKSALLDELYRWVLTQSGMAAHIETENKDSPDLRNSICWNDERLLKRLHYMPANSQEEWMEALTAMINRATERFAKIRKKKRDKPKRGEPAADFRARTAARVIAGNPGWLYPLIFGIDSLTAVSSAKTIEGILGRGHAQDRFANEARYLADFARALPEMLRGKPIILASTNHLKPGQDDNMLPVDNIPGGKAMRFMNTIELKMVKKRGFKTATREGNRVEITCLKNSLGATARKISVDMKWYWELDAATGEPVQRTLWDWDTAAIDCLLAQKNVSAKRWKDVNDVVDLHATESGVRLFWSKALGIPSTSPVDFREAGAILESRQDLLDALYKAMNLKHRTKFVPGTDYTDIQEVLRRSALALERVYAPHEISAAGAAELLALDGELGAAAPRPAVAAGPDEAEFAVPSRQPLLEEDDDDD